MLEAFYDKICLAKSSGNCLEMHLEYLHVSVAQKLTELRNFCYQGHLDQFGRTLGTLWEYSGDTLNVFEGHQLGV